MFTTFLPYKSLMRRKNACHKPNYLAIHSARVAKRGYTSLCECLTMQFANRLSPFTVTTVRQWKLSIEMATFSYDFLILG